MFVWWEFREEQPLMRRNSWACRFSADMPSSMRETSGRVTLEQWKSSAVYLCDKCICYMVIKCDVYELDVKRWMLYLLSFFQCLFEFFSLFFFSPPTLFLTFLFQVMLVEWQAEPMPMASTSIATFPTSIEMMASTKSKSRKLWLSWSGPHRRHLSCQRTFMGVLWWPTIPTMTQWKERVCTASHQMMLCLRN